MDCSSLRAQFDADGFVVIRSFLSDPDFRELTEQLDRYIGDVVPSLSDGDAFYEDRSRPDTLKQLARIEQDSFFAKYMEHSRWRQTAEALLGEAARAHGAEWFNKPPQTNHVTPPHQDNFYFCLAPASVLTMWLALDTIDEENGCLRYVRGSHRRGIRPHHRTRTLGFSQGIADFGEGDELHEAAIHAQPNDLLIHHGNTIHRAHANQSANRHRRSFAMVFQGESAQRDRAAFERYLASAKSQREEFGLTH